MKTYEEVYRDCIKRLMLGWKPNYDEGELLKEWWHPHKPCDHEPFVTKEDMTDQEFKVMSIINDQMAEEALRKLRLDE